MKKILCLILCILILFSFVRAGLGVKQLGFWSFVQELPNVAMPVKPVVDLYLTYTGINVDIEQPRSFVNPFSSFTNLDGIVDVLNAIGDMFLLLGQNIVTLVQWVIYGVTYAVTIIQATLQETLDTISVLMNPLATGLLRFFGYYDLIPEIVN